MSRIYKLLTGLMLCLTLCAGSWSVEAQTTDYHHEASWAYWAEGQERSADCFLICPTVYITGDEPANLSLKNQEVKANFVGALNMERGIYESSCVMYAPFYQQASLEVYELPEEEREQYFEKAYKDVRKAFRYYLRHSDEKRPLVLAGFSQGADMAVRLLQELGTEEKLINRLVACYAIGWRVTPQQVESYPHLRIAEGAEDTGVVISFTTEAEGVSSALFIPTTTLSINPLNWRRDSTYASRELNLGACFTDYSGKIVKEIPQLTGAYLEPERGALKVDRSVSPKDYPALLPICEEGIFHIYDYLFFYRNLQTNVRQRVDSFQRKG